MLCLYVSNNMENLMLCMECNIDDLNKEKKKYINKKCEHGKRKTRCIECGGSEICSHGKQKGKCKDCGGNIKPLTEFERS